ncbi:MAG TPA: VPLPA-CTERM-specific exosortase XrtD [Marinagarivorans sp.]
MVWLRPYWPVLPLLCIPYFYSGALINLVERWFAETEYSHGVVIPLISAYIISERWQAIKQGAGSGSWWGVVVLAIALALLIAGEISALFAMVQVSFVALLWGLSLSYLGWRSARLLSAPIFILLFAIPLPYFLEVALTAKLQLLSSRLGVEFIQWLGMPVFLSGNVIDLGRYQLEVVEACSGLRFLYPLMSIGFIVAYFYRGHWSKRLMVFLSTIPITVLMNSARIALTAWLVERYGLQATQGTVHDAEGWVVFAACLVFLAGEILLLEAVTTRRPLKDILGLDGAPEAGSALPRHVALRRGPAYGACAALLAASLCLVFLSQRQYTAPPATHLALFPDFLKGWQAIPQPLDGRVENKLKLTDYYMANFKHPQVLEPINLYVAYYANQRKGQSPHSPKVCMPGGGWEIESFERKLLDGHRVNRALIVKEGQKQLVYYWFAERGQIVANEYYKKWLLFTSFIYTGRTDGALVRVTIPVVDNTDIAASEQKVQAFIREAMPVLATFLPDSRLY